MKKLIVIAGLVTAFAASVHAQNMDGMDMKKMPASAEGGQGSQAAPAAHAEGTIKALDPQSGKITLAHGPVAELKWPAMTMGFQANPAQLEGLKVGDRVKFGFRMEGGVAKIVSIQKQ
ncbi:copper-binding protein [Pseudomonas putida]|uniref:copper-binding protein n=1 Tax=Pseudomonas putida TaxID=303 RepID=UPI001F51D619|nr:copper-binding protein [Pseudomonas putida]MCI1021456.1 copper-binding protein [Pseudomonas putida]